MDSDVRWGEQHDSRTVNTRSRSRTLEITGGDVVTPTETIPNGSILITDGVIEHVDSGGPVVGDGIINATGKVVLPGLIDIHGDDIERHLEPRKGATVDSRRAIQAADRANILAGITTKLHAVAFEEANEESRSIARANEIARSIVETKTLIGDNRLHARCELADDSETAVRKWINRGAVDLVSLINHAPGMGQYGDTQRFMERYTADGGLSEHSVNQLIDKRKSVSTQLMKERGHRLQAIALSHGIPVASHDDESVEEVCDNARSGTTISEFPVTMEAASSAKEVGLTTIMGAPNLVRGASLWDNISVRDAIEKGLVDIVCSDYHPPSLLAAPFIPTGEPLHERVARVSKNPADVLGLRRRGRIEPGARADIIIIEQEPIPTIESVIINGRQVFSTAGENPRR